MNASDGKRTLRRGPLSDSWTGAQQPNTMPLVAGSDSWRHPAQLTAWLQPETITVHHIQTEYDVLRRRDQLGRLLARVHGTHIRSDNNVHQHQCVWIHLRNSSREEFQAQKWTTGNGLQRPSVDEDALANTELGLLWPWPLTFKIKSGHHYGLLNIPCQFYQNCSRRSSDIMRTISDQTNGRTNERTERRTNEHS